MAEPSLDRPGVVAFASEPQAWKNSELTLDPKNLKGRLKIFGGSVSDHWNNILANQAISSLWMDSEEDARERQRSATMVALVGIGPKDELEGMMAAQLIAAHNATMECYRRAMIPEQTFEGQRESLAPLSRAE